MNGSVYMKIGEVAEQTGLSISNIRFYEKKGLIEPKRNEQSKYRDYTEENVKRLKQIILYRKMDMPLEKIACVLDGQNSLEEMVQQQLLEDRKSTRLNSSHRLESRMPSSA